MHLTPSGMRMFIAVIEERSFTRAANREGATQSGVSQQVKKLELGLGVTLLHRRHGHVIPTPAGERLYQRCAAIVRSMASAEEEIRSYGRGLEGEISVGLMPILTKALLGPVLRRMRETYPNATVHVREGVSDQLIHLVSAQALDLAIVPDVDPPDALSISYLGRAPEMLVMRPDAGADRGAVDLRTVTPLKLITPAHSNIRTQRILNYLFSIEVEPDEILELDPLFAVLEYVSSSDYATIFPNIMLTQEIANGGLCVRKIDNPPFFLSLAVIKPKSSAISRLGRVFLDMFREELSAKAGLGDAVHP